MQSDFFSGLGQRPLDISIFQIRRKELLEAIIKETSCSENDVIVLFAAFEGEHERFRQDKTFFYYTGINEPATALVIDMRGKSTLYVPNYFRTRVQWSALPDALAMMDAKALGVDAVELLGDEPKGYIMYPYFSRAEYECIINVLESVIACSGSIFSVVPDDSRQYTVNRSIFCNLQKFIPNVQDTLRDISSFIAMSRRRKDIGEIEKIYRAIEVTELAHESAVEAIKAGVVESEVQASLEYIMTASHARPSFPSIVATGDNATILHYYDNKAVLKNGDLIIIDIGAELDNYCADLTRTYPVSGVFTQRQKELYIIVLETQEYIATIAKPGMWLKNAEKADQSLYHLAYNYLEKCGYAHYFPHGIGHFLGLDVHDVGNYNEPLHEGDVITIEPGIYIKEERIGIRIEDNYWITKDGTMCLSENLPKDIDDIEAFMQQIAKEESDEHEGDDSFIDDEDEYNEEDDFH